MPSSCVRSAGRHVDRRFVCVGALLIGSIARADGTAIGDLALAMQPGTWAELPTSNLTATIGNTGGSSDTILSYADEGKWDPGSKRFFYKGGDHNAIERFISFDAATNTWVLEPHPPWMPTGVTQNHSYDYLAIDGAKQILFYANERYDIKTKTWLSALPSSGLPSFGRAHFAQEYFPGLGLVRIGHDEVYLFSDGATAWTRLATGVAFTVPSSCTYCHVIAEYSPVHQVMIFGGGDASNRLFKLDASRTVTAIRSPPVSEVRIYSSVLTVDPVSGDFLLVHGPSRGFWKYSALTDTWAPLPNQILPFQAPLYSAEPAFALIAAPIDGAGVVMFVQYDDSRRGRVFLYKHSPRAVGLDAGIDAGPRVSPDAGVDGGSGGHNDGGAPGDAGRSALADAGEGPAARTAGPASSEVLGGCGCSAASLPTLCLLALSLALGTRRSRGPGPPRPAARAAARRRL